MLMLEVVKLLLLLLVPSAHSNMMMMIRTESRPELQSGFSGSSTDGMEQHETTVPPVAPSVDTFSPSPNIPLTLELETPVPSEVLGQVPSVMLDPNIRISSRESKIEAPSRICVYIIDVKTGTQWGAGTDSTISMKLTGSSTSSPTDNDHQDEVSFVLPDYDNDSFDAGNNDKFQVNTKCVTNICKMVLYTDHNGLFADWFVESVSLTLTTGAPSESHQWLLDQWLPASGGPLSVIRDNCS